MFPESQARHDEEERGARTQRSQEPRSTRDERSKAWLRRQWDRYDRLVGTYSRLDDDRRKKAVCLAFARSMLNDNWTERMLSDMLFEITSDLTDGCEEVLGKDDVANSKTQLLFLVRSLPLKRWQRALFDVFSPYFRRDGEQPLIPFRHFLGSFLGLLARNSVDPLADVIEPWL